MSDFNPEKGICGNYYYSYLILRKRQQKVAECLWKLKPSETTTANGYRQQIIKLDRAVKDKDRNMMEDTIRSFCSMITPGPMSRKQFRKPYKYLFWSMHSAILGERFSSCDEVTKLVDQWIASKEPDFFIAESICCLKEKRYTFQWKVFRMKYFILLFQFLFYFL